LLGPTSVSSTSNSVFSSAGAAAPAAATTTPADADTPNSLYKVIKLYNGKLLDSCDKLFSS